MLSSQEQFIHELQRSQWLSAAEIARNQRPLIERLVRHAATQTEFYRERLKSVFDSANPAASVDLSRWDEVPVLRRRDAVDHVDAMTARKVPRDSGSARRGESSGSTGRPLSHLRSGYAVTVANCLLQRIYELFDVDLNAALAHITVDKNASCRYPAGGRFKQWNFHAPEADLFVLHVGASAPDQLEWLQRMRPAHVMTYPETLRTVADAAETQGSRLKFQTFLSTGESLLPATRTAIARTFGCRVIDIYGAREIGPIAFQCPDAQGYHVCAEAMMFELLDETDRPVGPGCYGRVVVTPLYNFAMPFIRYDVGDYALAGAACSCGRGLPWIQEVGGRTRNMFVMPDGSRKRWPSLVIGQMPSYLSYKQIQFVQTDVNTLQIKYLPATTGTEEPAARLSELTDFLRGELHGALNVKVIPVDCIERGAGMKLEQFISRVVT